MPIEYISRAGNSEKDVSNDYERGHIIGKEYELIQDVYLTQFTDGEELILIDKLITVIRWVNNQNKEINPYAKKEIIYKGTKFRVCSVFVKTNYGNELCSQTILANIIDDEGNTIPQKNCSGKIVPLNVSYLFRDTFQMANENWTFTPSPHLIKELRK